MDWVMRLAKLGALGATGYFVGVYVLAALVAVLLVWWLLASESAVLGE